MTAALFYSFSSDQAGMEVQVLDAEGLQITVG